MRVDPCGFRNLLSDPVCQPAPFHGGHFGFRNLLSDPVCQPAFFFQAEDGIRDMHGLMLRTQVIHKQRNGHKPSLLSTQPADKALELGMDLATVKKPICEMGIDDANPSLGLEPVLIFLRNQPAKSDDIFAVAGTEPGVDPRLRCFVVRHRGVNAIQVDLTEHKVAHVANVLLAQVTPEVFRSVHLARTFSSCPLKKGGSGVDIAPDTVPKAMGAPVEVFMASFMITMHSRHAAKVFRKCGKSLHGASPVGRAVLYIVQRQLHTSTLEALCKAPITWFLQ